MRQPAHFHKYDVLEHSFRCMAYAPPSIRWAALLHDVGKPFCMNRDGNFHAHAEEGGRIAANMMRRMRAPGALRERTKRLVALHMRDCNGCMREGKVRQEIVHDYELIDDLLALKQADYTACKDDPSPAPTVVKWKRIYADMVREGVPFTLQMLAVNGDDAAAAGIAAARRGTALRTLQGECIMNGARNERGRLIARLQRIAQADGANKEVP